MATPFFRRRLPFARLSRWLAPAACWVALACQRQAPPAPPAPASPAVAHLEALHGTVSVRLHGAGAEAPGREQQPLADEDFVTTGADGEVDVVFAGNNRVHLGPNGALSVHGGTATATQVGVIMLDGAARAQGGGAGLGLSVGTPLGTAKLSSTQLTVLEVDVRRGLHLTTGEVNLVRPDRLEVLPLILGQTLEVGALPVLLPSQQLLDVPGLTVQSLAPVPPPPPARTAHLRAHHGRVLRQGAGADSWQAAAAGDALGDGDSLRLLPGGDAEVTLADNMDVAMHGGGEFAFGRLEEADGGLRARYTVRRGNARLHIVGATDGHAPAASQEVGVAGATLQVRPGAREARVDVQDASLDRARVVVRYGRLRVGPVDVEAGQAVTVVRGRVSAPQPAFVAPVQLTPGRPAVLFAQRGVPPLRFGADAPGEHHVEVADAVDMAALRAAENTRQGALASDEVALGTTYWRSGGAPAAKLEVRPEPSRSCVRCAREEAIDDTGAPSEVVYQGDPPALRLRWSEVPEARAYRVRVADAATPRAEMLARTCTGTQLRLAPGELSRGTYLWSVTPLDAAGAPLATPHDNTLRLSFDNVVKGLRLRYPQREVSVRRARLVTSGAVERGSQLQLNGREVRLDADGAFAERVAVRPGLNRLVYTVRRTGEPDRIYVRDVVRAGKASRRVAQAAAPTP